MTKAGPSPSIHLVKDLAAGDASGNGRGVGFTVVNFNTSAYTLKCVESLAMAFDPPSWVLILDNGSSSDEIQHLTDGLQHMQHTSVLLFRSETNLGFALATNFLVDQLLSFGGCHYIGLLNNDAVAQPEIITALMSALNNNPKLHGMAGGRMHQLRDPQKVDTLGITIYGSLMPADRLQIEDSYLGPTGGCCLITRRCVEDIVAQTGYFFDPRFFCYCEDTDLVLRANLLGYEPAYVDQLVALHAGQASNGGRKDEFIAYHGWRNNLWMHLKLVPTSVLWRHAHWLLLAHSLSVGRYCVAGKFALVWRVYRDAFQALPEFLRDRASLKGKWRISPSALNQRIGTRFYRQGYIAQVLRQMFGFVQQR